MTDTATRIFFSYARSDAQFVLKLARALRSEGLSAWVDQLDIAKGARWDDEISKALNACTCMLAVLSPATADSQNVQDEVSYALEDKKTVIPILLQKCNVPFRLRRLQYIDFTGDYDSAYQELRTALGMQAPAVPARPVEPPASAPAAELRSTAPEPPERAPIVAQPPPSAPERPANVSPVQARASTAPPPAIDPAAAKRPTKVVLGGVAAAAVVALAGYLALSDRAPSRPANDPSAGSAAAPATALSDKQVSDLVARYLQAQNGANATELLKFYADKVDYFDQRGVGKDFILKDKQNYYKRWPEVDKHLAGTIDTDRSDTNGSLALSYPVAYVVRNAARNDTKSGTVREELHVRQIDGQMLIVAQQERAQSARN